MNLIGLIGHPVSHSRSPEIFSAFFKKSDANWNYRLFDLPKITEFPALLASLPELRGLNVTIPHKSTVMPYLDELQTEVSAIGAVNTIKIIRNNNELYSIGFNTDVYGFTKALQHAFGLSFDHALILGSGGSSKAVQFALKQLNIPFTIVSRTDTNAVNYENITEDLIQKHRLVINATPLGMSPNTDHCPPVPYHFLTPDHCCFDLVYNPAETLFMRKCALQGASVENGTAMLQFQAEKSWEIFQRDS